PVGGGGAGNQPGHGPRPLSRPRQQRRGTARRGGARPGHRPGHGHSLRHPPQGRGAATTPGGTHGPGSGKGGRRRQPDPPLPATGGPRHPPARRRRGADALMRWAPSIDNPVSPDHFIPLAETSGKIQGLTEWALNTAMRETMELDPDGALSVSVNVSASSLYDPNLVLAVESGLAIWGLPPRRLTLEITEGALMKNPALCFEHLARLRALGVRVAIDDFGTGFSSLAYFKAIPADEVKIDQAFVRHMATDDQDARIVQLVIDLAHAFGLKVVAEGVESGEALARLGDLHCDLA